MQDKIMNSYLYINHLIKESNILHVFISKVFVRCIQTANGDYSYVIFEIKFVQKVAV